MPKTSRNGCASNQITNDIRTLNQQPIFLPILLNQHSRFSYERVSFDCLVGCSTGDVLQAATIRVWFFFSYRQLVFVNWKIINFRYFYRFLSFVIPLSACISLYIPFAHRFFLFLSKFFSTYINCFIIIIFSFLEKKIGFTNHIWHICRNFSGSCRKPNN